MTKYQINGVQEFTAQRYGYDNSYKLVKKCYANHRGVINVVPSDLLGAKTNSFNAVQTSSGWVQIKEGDYIITKDEKVQVMSQELFEMLGVIEVQ